MADYKKYLKTALVGDGKIVNLPFLQTTPYRADGFPG